MEYSVKVRCEGYAEVTVDADSEDEAISTVMNSYFYVSSDEFIDSPMDVEDVYFVSCKEKNFSLDDIESELEANWRNYQQAMHS